jgi:hypothetical protein
MALCQWVSNDRSDFIFKDKGKVKQFFRLLTLEDAAGSATLQNVGNQ